MRGKPVRKTRSHVRAHAHAVMQRAHPEAALWCPSDSVEHMPAPRVPFSQHRVIEIVFWGISHPDPFHHPSRADVSRHREGHNFVQAEMLESEAENGSRPLRGVAHTPVTLHQSPAYFDAGCEVRLEGRQGQSDESGEWRDGSDLDGPESETIVQKLRFDPVGEGVAFPASQRGGKMLHHHWVSVERRERRAVLRKPAAKEETSGPDFERQAHESPSHVEKL
jgi:hypothetical protein